MDREAWNERYASAPLLWTVDPGPFLGAQVGPMAPGHALDLGAGEGRNSLWLAGRGWEVTAVDFSDVALDRGATRARQMGLDGRVHWVLADLDEFRPPADTFDLALLAFVHPRPPHRARLLADTVTSLRPEGVLLIAGYHPDHARRGEGGPRDPDILFTPEELVGELDGMVIEVAERLELEDAVDTIVRARRPAEVSGAPEPAQR